MSLHSLSSCLMLLCFHPVFGPRALASSAAAGTIKLYDDFNCNHPSTLNPTVNLPLSVCLVTTGGEGLVIAETPPCPQSTATLIYYQDSACGVPTDNAISSIVASNCFQLAAGIDIYNARSVMFSCQPPANNPQPSSTSTAVVSALAAVATGSNTDVGGGNSVSAPSSTPTDTSNQKNGVGSNGPTATGGTSNSTTLSPASGLGTGDIIALSVGLGIGVPTILVMLATWLLPDFRYKLKAWFLGEMRNQSAFKHHGTHSWPYSHTQEMYPRQQNSFSPYHH